MRPRLPFSSVAGAAFKQGFHDTFFNVIQENVEESIYNEGLMLTPEEANNRYSLPGLEFNEPIREGLAALKFRRKQSEIARQTVMQQGSNGLLSLRGVGSMAAAIIANNLSPIDFAFNFAPIAGATKYGRASSLMSKAASRGVKKLGGLGKPVSKVSMPAFHRMVSAGIDASVGNLILEVPLYLQNEKDQTRHTLGDVALNVGLGGMFGMGLSGLGTMMRGAARKWAAASPTTKAKALQAHFNEAKADEAARIADEVLESDSNVIRQRVIRERAQVALTEAIREAESEVPYMEAAFRTKLIIDSGVKTGAEDIVDIAKRNLDNLKRHSPVKHKAVSEALPIAETGDDIALDTLARALGVIYDPGSTGRIPKDFADKWVTNPVFKAKQKGEIFKRRGETAAPEIENQVKREVLAERIRLVQRSYREALKKMNATSEARLEAARIADEVLESDPNVIRQRVISAKEAAEVEVDARMPEIERQVRARLKVQGKLGDAPKEAIEEIAERALPIFERKADGRAKIVKRLLERSKNGEVDATENLAKVFYLEYNPKSKGAPEPFITGKVSDVTSAQQMVNLEDVIDALPKRAKKDLGMANVDRFDVEAEIKREVESARIRLVRRSYREALEKMKSNDTKAQRVAQELDANAEPSKPLRPQDDVRGQAADEATLTEDINVLTEAMGDTAESVKKNFNQGPDEKGVQAGLDCLIKNA